jgi:urease gamma subunit
MENTQRHKCIDCDILKAIKDIMFANNNLGIDEECQKNIEDFIHNITVSSSFAHKTHIILKNNFIKEDSPHEY